MSWQYVPCLAVQEGAWNSVEQGGTSVVMASHMDWIPFTATATATSGVASVMLKRRLYERAHSCDVIM